MESPILSTMTVLYKTNLKFDTTKLAECLPIDKTVIKVEKKGVVLKGESSRDRIKHRAKKEEKPPSNTGFSHNSITLVMMNDGDHQLPQKEITVKIFQNGVFHLTGILDDRYDKDTMKILLNILNTCYVHNVEDPIDELTIVDRKVVLMNYTTKLTSNLTIPREALHNSIRNLKNENIVSHFDPDVYPAVKIFIENEKSVWKANVFRTGRIILTGIKSQEECVQLTARLLALFEQVMPQKLI
jgi:TATA-box binding protein (TBP) (component of TFIID and TFIIIB)